MKRKKEVEELVERYLERKLDDVGERFSRMACFQDEISPLRFEYESRCGNYLVFKWKNESRFNREITVIFRFDIVDRKYLRISVDDPFVLSSSESAFHVDDWYYSLLGLATFIPIDFDDKILIGFMDAAIEGFLTFYEMI